jgi:multisubunit Na+/H+ antiporter MnhF subunit
MSAVLNIVLNIALVVHLGLVAVVIWRALRGENVIDRVMGLDLLGTFSLAVLVLTAMLSERPLYLDVALGLAALSFIGTVALSKYVADEQMF